MNNLYHVLCIDCSFYEKVCMVKNILFTLLFIGCQDNLATVPYSIRYIETSDGAQFKKLYHAVTLTSYCMVWFNPNFDAQATKVI